MVSGYDWRDGIGDPDKRPPRYDYAWRALEPNDMGIDDYMVLNKLLNMEPYICANTGFGDAHSAAEEVEYANGSVNTPMGKLRAANGHPDPYKVTWWNVGNEMFGPWQLGFMSLDHYVIKHNMVAQAMRRVDPAIKIVAAGATPVEASQSRCVAHDHRKTRDGIRRAGGFHRRASGPFLGVPRCDRRAYISPAPSTGHSIPKSRIT